MFRYHTVHCNFNTRCKHFLDTIYFVKILGRNVNENLVQNYYLLPVYPASQTQCPSIGLQSPLMHSHTLEHLNPKVPLSHVVSQL